MKAKLALIIALIAITTACSTTKKVPQNAVDAGINNIAWGVASFKGQAITAADFPNGIPSITFNMKDGRINGSDGCNNFMGLATYKDNTIKTGPIASTKMACPGKNIQTDFYEALASAHLTWQLNGETLRLLVNDAEVMTLREKQ